MVDEKKTDQKGDSWCTIWVNDSKTNVQVRHIGKGKFTVVNDELEGNLIGKVLDASDIFHC